MFEAQACLVDTAEGAGCLHSAASLIGNHAVIVVLSCAWEACQCKQIIQATVRGFDGRFDNTYSKSNNAMQSARQTVHTQFGLAEQSAG